MQVYSFNEWKTLLARYSRNFGHVFQETYSNGDTQGYIQFVNGELENLVDYTYHLLLQYELNPLEVQEMMNYFPFFSSLMSRMDYFKVFKQRFKSHPTQSNLAKMLFFYPMFEEQPLNIDELWKLDRHLVLHFLFGICSSVNTYHPLVLSKIEQAYRFLLDKFETEDIHLIDMPSALISNVYYRSAYYFQYGQYKIRQLLNKVLQKSIDQYILNQVEKHPYIDLTEGQRLNFEQWVFGLFDYEVKDKLKKHQSIDEVLQSGEVLFNLTFIVGIHSLTKNSAIFKTHSRFLGNIKPIFKVLFWSYLNHYFGKEINHKELIQKIHNDGFDMALDLIKIKTVGIAFYPNALPIVSEQEKQENFCVVPEWDELIVCEHEVVFDKLRQALSVEKNGVSISYYSDVGPSVETWLFANTRIANIQMMSTGHPCSSAKSRLDYVLSEEDFTSENTEEWVTEQLIRLPNYFMPYTLQLGYQDQFIKQKASIIKDSSSFEVESNRILEKMKEWIDKIDVPYQASYSSKNISGYFMTLDGQKNKFGLTMFPQFKSIKSNKHTNLSALPKEVTIGIVGFATKFNLPFMSILQEIQQKGLKLGVSIKYAIFINRLSDLTYPMCHQCFGDFLIKGSFDIYTGFPFDQYIALLERIDFAISPFPYGNDNTAIDLLYHGILSFSQQRDDMASRTDSAVASRCGIDLNLVTSKKLSDLVNKILFFATNLDEMNTLKRAFMKECKLLRIMKPL